MELITTYDRVLSELRTAILVGQHPPGARLREVELAELYGVSRIPVREALRRLEAEGLIASSPNRGVTVRALERDDIDELFAFRLALERLAVRAAAARGADLRGDVAERRAAVHAALNPAHMTDVIAQDRAFHADLALAGGNRHVVDALGERWAHISRVMHMYLTSIAYPESVWDEHAAIVEAVAVGNADRADELLTDHITNSRRIVLALIPSRT
ncbi:MAG: GntR family transcriptional regulator [Candidatus Velthaea sp.]